MTVLPWHRVMVAIMMRRGWGGGGESERVHSVPAA